MIGIVVWTHTALRLVPLRMSSDECVLPMDDTEMAKLRAEMLASTRSYDLTLTAGPIAAPIVAFMSYEAVARETRQAIEFFGQRNAWFSADGNSYEIEILAPTINGVVMPAIAIALGTLAATTISTLRERQLDVRERLNNELCDVELLRAALNALDDDDFTVPGASSALATQLLRDYVARLIFESKPGTETDLYEARQIADNELNQLAMLLHVTNDRHKRSESVSSVAMPLIANLASHRSARLADQAATYPAIHYAVLALTALSIIVSFLLESDQEVLRFLDAIQLRLLFAILVGCFSGLAALIIDLSDLNKGGFRITPTFAQLFAVRDNLDFDLCLKEAGVDPLRTILRLDDAPPMPLLFPTPPVNSVLHNGTVAVTRRDDAASDSS